VRKENQSKDFGDHRDGTASRYRNIDDRSPVKTTTLGDPQRRAFCRLQFQTRESFERPAERLCDYHSASRFLLAGNQRRLPARTGRMQRSPTPSRSRHVNRRIGIAPSRPLTPPRASVEAGPCGLIVENRVSPSPKGERRLKSSAKDQKTKSRKDQARDRLRRSFNQQNRSNGRYSARSHTAARNARFIRDSEEIT
jgi:hypothetical protein